MRLKKKRCGVRRKGRKSGKTFHDGGERQVMKKCWGEMVERGGIRGGKV